MRAVAECVREELDGFGPIVGSFFVVGIVDLVEDNERVGHREDELFVKDVFVSEGINNKERVHKFDVSIEDGHREVEVFHALDFIDEELSVEGDNEGLLEVGSGE